jgi:hypothetical protein
MPAGSRTGEGCLSGWTAPHLAPVTEPDPVAVAWLAGLRPVPAGGTVKSCRVAGGPRRCARRTPRGGWSHTRGRPPYRRRGRPWCHSQWYQERTVGRGGRPVKRACHRPSSMSLPKLNSQARITTTTMGVIAEGHSRSAVWCGRLPSVAARRDAGQRHVGVQRTGGFRGRLARGRRPRPADYRSGQFRARLTQVKLHRLRLTAAEEQLSRIAFVAVPADLILVSLPKLGATR